MKGTKTSTGFKPLAPDLFAHFQQFLIEESGLYFDEHRLSTLAEKLSERLEVCGVKSYEDYYRYLKFNSKRRLEFKSLVDTLTIGETFFFRNEAQFEVLKNFVLPQLFKRELKHVLPKIRIWCAGCSTGEEPYSLAILLKELLPNFERWEISILATDINRNSLKSCATGIYGSRTIQTVSSLYLEQYFTRSGQNYLLSDVIKKMVKFTPHNLARDPYTLPGMLEVDIIFCRNVTIYFDLATLKKVVAGFSTCLLPDGFLFIGHSETLWGVSEDFTPIEFPQTFLYQKRGSGEVKPMVSPTISLPVHVDYQPAPEKEKIDSSLAALIQTGIQLGNEGEYEKALACFQEVVSRDNLCLEAHYFIGVLLAKMEKYAEAIEPFRRVLYIDPQQTMGYFHLGALYRFLDKKEKAKKEYLHCLQFLEGKKDEEDVPFSDGLTVGVLFQAVHRALESLKL